MSGQSGGRRLCLSKLNDQLTCKLCGGYYIDATTIIECLHSFCRSCIVKYLENNKYCPICEVQVHKSKPLLNIRPDHTLQDIVYKLVPGCYQNEMRCRREFYSKNPEAKSQATSPEARGEPIESHIYSPDESLSLSLEYYNPISKDVNETNVTTEITLKQPKRYLRCPAAVTVFHLQKLIRAKYGLTEAHRVDIMYKEEPLCSSYTLMDIMYIYHWRRKVPLHLSYRIFESSPKRIKLSEDNANYKKSLSNAGIDYAEPKDEESSKREWKEVQLKISEAGVMSVTDISVSENKRNSPIENSSDQRQALDGTNTENKNNSSELVKDCNLNESVKDTKQTALDVNARVNENSETSLKIKNSETASETTTESLLQGNGITLAGDRQDSKTEKKTLCNSSKTTLTAKCESQNSEDKIEDTKNSSQTVKSQNVKSSALENETVQEGKTEVKMDTDAVVDEPEKKQLSTINNNTIRTESKIDNKQCTKSVSEEKTLNAGSKLDALSAKLQFQPKIGQVNNTYSKRTLKEKRTMLHSLKKTEGKMTLESSKLDVKNVADGENVKTRLNCGTATTAKGTVTAIQQKSSGINQQRDTATTIQQTSLPVSSSTTQSAVSIVSVTSGQNFTGKNGSTVRSQSTSVSIQQALNSLDQLMNVSERSTTKDLSQKVSCQVSAPNQKTSAASDSTVSISLNVSASTMCQGTSTFPYSAQSAGNTAMLKSPTKTNASCSIQKIPVDTTDTSATVSCTLPDGQICSVPRFSIQSPSMSIYSISTSLKNSYGGTNQSISSTAVTTTPTTSTKQTTTKLNVEHAGAYSIPPCPDAIPISLMKPTVRKHEIIAKGTNLNDICAKIGSLGSKINDICAKISENSKERNKAEARTKSEIPDLLKIAKRCPSTSSSTDSTVKHIPNIPNVPIYTPSNSAASAENKGVYSTKEDTTVPGTPVSQTISTSQGHRMSLKKQSQPVGYKTLRDPPKSWNPTLSRNNYVAVKNQAKELQNQSQTAASEGTNKLISSKPAKIFKMRNMPRYLGNPASGVKPMYGVSSESKDKEQPPSSAAQKNTTLSMMKIDPKTLSPIVSTVNSPIVSPPPYSPNARSYQNTPFSRDICRNTGSPISPRNSPVNMLSTNPFIPSPTPNTNPRLIYSHFPPPFPDASRFPNPLIRSPIGIPPPSAFHSSLPPSINKLYQRSTSYMPQTTASYSQPPVQPPTVQRIPPSTSSSPKSPKTSSPSTAAAAVSSSFNVAKPDMQTSVTAQTTTTGNHGALHLTKNPTTSQQMINAFNLSKTGSSTSTTTVASDFSKPLATDSTVTQTPSISNCPVTTSNASTIVSILTSTVSPKEITQERATSTPEQKSTVAADTVKTDEKEPTLRKEEEGKSETEENDQSNGQSKKAKTTVNQAEKKEKSTSKVNGDVTVEPLNDSKAKEEPGDQVEPAEKSAEQAKKMSSREPTNTTKDQIPDDLKTGKTGDGCQAESKNEELSKANEQIQGKKLEVERNKAES